MRCRNRGGLENRITSSNSVAIAASCRRFGMPVRIGLAVLGKANHISYESFESFRRPDIKRQLCLNDPCVPEPMRHSQEVSQSSFPAQQSKSHL